MAVVLNNEKRGIFSSLGKILPGESDNVPDEDVAKLQAKFNIEVLTPPKRKTTRKKAVTKKAAVKPAQPPKAQDDEDWDG